jgi:phosphatidylserine/phosphatidylglycerophosphate/cardiolipin synthase-like enzyme
MVRAWFLFLFALLVPALVPGIPAAGAQPEHAWQACFTPDEDCTGLVIRTVQAAEKTILVQAYAFTSRPIARALADAKRRGVDVRVILDASNRSDRRSVADFLARAGIPVLIDAEHRVAHNAVMIIDGETVITGSFNFTEAAQLDNAENVLVIHNSELARRYEENWQRHAAHSQTYREGG